MCEECGKEISEDENFCPNCGCPITKKDSATTDEKILPQQVEITKIKIPIFKKSFLGFYCVSFCYSHWFSFRNKNVSR